MTRMGAPRKIGKYAASRQLDKETINNPPPDVAATVQKFREICESIAARGDLGAAARGMPQRLQRIIDAHGGPTKD